MKSLVAILVCGLSFIPAHAQMQQYNLDQMQRALNAGADASRRQAQRTQEMSNDNAALEDLLNQKPAPSAAPSAQRVPAILTPVATSKPQAARTSSASYPKLGRQDLNACAKEIGSVHQAEIRYLKKDSAEYCKQASRKGADKLDRDNCTNTQKFARESEAQAHLDWFYKGNGRCEGSSYPCFGMYSFTNVSDEEDVQLMRDLAKGPDRRSNEADFAFDTTPADKCLAKVWLAKYEGKGKEKSNAATQYGSLAIDKRQGNAYGWAVGMKTQAEADSKARGECMRGSSSCTIVMTFENACGAYSADQARSSTAYGWAWSSTQQQAEADATDQCRMRGGSSANCITRVWGCTANR